MGIVDEELAIARGYISSLLFYQTVVVLPDLLLNLQSWISLAVWVQLHGLSDYWLIENSVFPEVEI